MTRSIARTALALAFVGALGAPGPTAHADPGLLDDIEDLTEAIAEAPTALHLRLARAELYARIRDTDAAFADLAVAESVAPGEPRIRVVRAQTFLALGRAAEARVELESVVASTTGRAAMDAGATLARLDEREGLLTDAAAHYDVALANGDDVTLYLERGRILVRLGRADDAIRGYETGVQALGGSAVLRAELVPLLVSAGRARAALPHADALVASARARSRYLVLRADVHEALGDAARARADRDAALADAERLLAQRGSATSFAERGRALLALGRATEAARDLERAVRLGATSPEVRQLLYRARSIGGGR